MQIARSYLLAVESLVAQGRDQWQHGQDERDIISNITQAMKYAKQCRAIVKCPATKLAQDSTVVNDASSSESIQFNSDNDSCDTEQLLLRLLVVEAQLHCLHCDVNQKEDSKK